MSFCKTTLESLRLFYSLMGSLYVRTGTRSAPVFPADSGVAIVATPTLLAVMTFGVVLAAETPTSAWLALSGVSIACARLTGHYTPAQVPAGRLSHVTERTLLARRAHIPVGTLTLLGIHGLFCCGGVGQCCRVEFHVEYARVDHLFVVRGLKVVKG